jgi:hypothetical protein
MDQIQDEKVNVTARAGITWTADAARFRMRAGRMAEGGLVGGPPGRDKTPIWATRGEAVVPPHLVPAVAPFLAANGVPGFARGGLVPNVRTSLGALQGDSLDRMAVGLAKGLSAAVGRGLTLAMRTAWQGMAGRPGSWKAATDFLSGAGIPYSIMSTFRPGARTHASGALSFHALNRAVDLDGGHDKMRIWRALDRSGIPWRELIYSGAPTYIGRGARKPIGQLDPVTLADHWDHVHVALGKGGIVRRPTLALLGERGPEAVMPLSRAAQPATVNYNVNLDLRGSTFTGPPDQFVRAVTPRLRQAIKDVQRSSGVPASQQLR